MLMKPALPGLLRAAASCTSSLKRAGQVTVELLLVLPVFMLLLFFIMEMGNLGFQTILAHHCCYELARIGSLVAGPTGAGTGGGQRDEAGAHPRRLGVEHAHRAAEL